ncbi:endorhamnosidase, partial [Escherichia coli]|nr:endorhamnosidase [Escherichia coli]
DGLSLNGNYITSLTLLNSPKDRNNNFGVNNNKLTKGKVTVPMSPGATSGTADIPNPISGVIYSASVIPTDAANSMDTVSVSGTTITISRPTPVGVSLPTLVEYYLISSL